MTFQCILYCQFYWCPGFALLTETSDKLPGYFIIANQMPEDRNRVAIQEFTRIVVSNVNPEVRNTNRKPG